jgi:hypothetical protein
MVSYGFLFYSEHFNTVAMSIFRQILCIHVTNKHKKTLDRQEFFFNPIYF